MNITTIEIDGHDYIITQNCGYWQLSGLSGSPELTRSIISSLFDVKDVFKKGHIWWFRNEPIFLEEK